MSPLILVVCFVLASVGAVPLSRRVFLLPPPSLLARRSDFLPHPARLGMVRKPNANANATPQRSGTNKLGEVRYQVKREFWGNVEMVGESISVTGRTHGNPSPSVDGNEYADELSLLESELGYFTMIDAVAGERPVL